MALLLTLFTDGIYYWVLVLVIVWTLAGFIGWSFLEYRRLKSGGRAIAQRVGAVRLFIDNSQDAWKHSQGVTHECTSPEKVRYSARHIAVRDERDFPPIYRRYYETAQQLAIAAGLRMPILYVLPDEQGINGFVAGRHSQDMVMIVTQGALDKLSDDALYGLIGHEYGHILHGDARFNLQLMVVLAGLQIVYDWSDPISNSSHRSRYADYNDVSQNTLSSQKSIDRQARSTEAETENFMSHSDWIAYWRAHNQAQNRKSSAKGHSRQLQHRHVVNREAPRSIWTLLLHGLSFSSMASAQLIKHSFNRQRELLADATSVQLTRSLAVMETLKTIHQDSHGSRLSSVADINGLSHFFFASSGADLGDVSWFATHPSLAERMTAVNSSAYHDFAVQVARDKRLNQQKIDTIYEQRRLGGVAEINENSLSRNSNLLYKNDKYNIKKSALNSKATGDKDAFATSDNANHDSNSNGNGTVNDELALEAGLTFTVEKDKVVDGRLQASSDDEPYELLKPWKAKPNSDLLSMTLIGIEDLKKVKLLQKIVNHAHHPLGALTLIEAVLLCHQRRMLSATTAYDLQDIWIGLPNDNTCPVIVSSK
ncbi:M48 family metalloprotease [Psychrobacter sp.]|uniref:M48 family metalloprotease n=1 Tax=Psychrobacter sp. TaxID=56811 RepID=UPI002650BC65|nr:M48 family metalloprotease [Psychrobacter sp.]